MLKKAVKEHRRKMKEMAKSQRLKKLKEKRKKTETQDFLLEGPDD